MAKLCLTLQNDGIYLAHIAAEGIPLSPHLPSPSRQSMRPNVASAIIVIAIGVAVPDAQLGIGHSIRRTDLEMVAD